MLESISGCFDVKRNRLQALDVDYIILSLVNGLAINILGLHRHIASGEYAVRTACMPQTQCEMYGMCMSWFCM